MSSIYILTSTLSHPPRLDIFQPNFIQSQTEKRQCDHHNSIYSYIECIERQQLKQLLAPQRTTSIFSQLSIEITNQMRDSVLVSVPSSIINVIGCENRIPHILSLPRSLKDPFLSFTNDVVRRTNPTISYPYSHSLSLSLSLNKTWIAAATYYDIHNKLLNNLYLARNLT